MNIDKQKLVSSKTFCIMPWIHLSTEPSGDVKICCLASKTIRNDQNEVYNLGYHSIKEIYNNSQIRKNREDMLNGIQIPDCNHCWKEEASGGISQRTSFTNKWLADQPELVDKIKDSILNNYEVTYTPVYYDFRFGNLCNLKCRSCGSLNSTQINKEYKDLYSKTKSMYFSDSGEKYDQLNDWYKTEQFKTNVFDTLNTIEKIYVTGGEPTLIEENYELLSKLVEIDRAKHVTVMFNTNMTNLKDEFYDLISKFKHVEMAISIEGYGKVQEYLRYPSTWNHIDKNIRRLAALPNNVSIFAVPVVQIVNLEYITDFWNYIEEINSDYGFYRIRMLPIILDSPEISNIANLPLEYKLQCWNKIETFVKHSQWLKDDIYFMGRYNNIRMRCQTDSYNKELLSRFREFTELLDLHRAQSLNDVNPTLYKLINNDK